MGNSQSVQKINFEDMQFVIKNPESHILLNTLSANEQSCLIRNTINADNEENIINKYLTNRIKNIRIIIYGKNSNDDKTYQKYKQLLTLGFYDIYIYSGGLFEWLMLQDIYGFEEFPTTKKELDFIKYKPNKTLNIPLLHY